MAFLFFAAVFTLLGWLACEHDFFSIASSVPAAGPHTASSSPSSSPSASAPAGPVVSPSLPRRERRALARSRSRSSPPVPAWARPGSLLSPPRHRPVEDKNDTFLDVKSTEADGLMERVWDPINGWKWAAVRGERLAARMIPLPNSPPPSPVITPRSPPAAVPPAFVAASAPMAVSVSPNPAPAPIVISPPPRSVASILAGIPSLPQGLTHVFPLPAPAPLSQPQPLFGGLSLATPAKYASGSLTMVLPDLTPSVPMPLAPPLPTSLPAGADHKPQTDDICGIVAPTPHSSSPFAFGGGSIGVSAMPIPAPPSDSTFGAVFNFTSPSPFSSSAPFSSASGRPRDRRILKRVYEPRFEDDRDDDDSLMEKYWDAGFTTLDSLMQADIPMVTGCGLENIAGYISGSTVASFEHNLRDKENGLRRLANLLRWQCGSTRPQPPGGTVTLGQLITVLARVDELVRGFVADNGGQQQLFVQGDFFKWARTWRYLEKHWWQVRKTKLQQELDPSVYGQVVELVKLHQAHCVKFLREAPDEGKGRDW
ncbi:hypothetical protein AA0119_g8890 [Alternaria tenuissima]|uniref:Uncharacterized protein n=1 Tax=Alternaria tenuissima TaxID=119927 RepID=A0AB37WT07_9PLEO|nr:hypothetical protein AA0115_g2643 [Alternaria tenuissima]RYN94684.1 hypothetical protein AA0119_g8890 [Alternaria tenuissima]RYO10828.1 hypothetical protein AA0121_g10440 [Alternaria tenuissima]